MPRFRFQLNSPLIHAAILLALSLPYFINLGVSSIWDANEAFYAETPREMIASGDYLAPQFNFQPRVQKPPLTYWAVALSYKILGIHEFAVRFPGALAALGVLLFSYGMARQLFGASAALFAAAISATTARIFILERRLPIDILLLFFLTGTLFFLIRAIDKRNTCSWAWAYAFAALGFLTKGPIAAIIPAGACLIWMGWSRKLKFSDVHLLSGSAIFICLALPYYVLSYKVHGWTYIAPFFLSDNLGRFASETLGPSRNVFYYISIYASDFFPWSLISLAALYWLWRHRRTMQPLKSQSFGLLIFWCVLTFMIFSLSKNKQEYYIAPMYPAAAVLIAGVLGKISGKNALHSELENPSNTDRNRTQGIALSPQEPQASSWPWIYGLLAFLQFIFSLVLPYILRTFIPGILFVLHYAPSLILISGSGLTMWSIIRRRYEQCFVALATSLWIIFLLGSLIYVPALETVRPVKSFCSRVESQWCRAAGDEAGFFRASLPSMVFYLKQPVFQEDSFDEMMRRFRSDRRIFCILSSSDYARFSDRQMPLYILDRRPHFSVKFGNLFGTGKLPGKELLLVSNRSYSKIPCR